MFELMETDINDDEILSQFLDATEKAIGTISSAETGQTPEANIPGALQNVPQRQPTPAIPPINWVQNNTGFPQLPGMRFPNSNVTINYNYNFQK